jgi:hypothetical protein
MRSSPLSDLYAPCVAEQLPLATRRAHHAALAGALDGLLHGSARRDWLAGLQVLCGESGVVEPVDTLLRELIARLDAEPGPAPELPAWVRLAQQTREIIPFDRLGEAVDLTLSAIATALPAATRVYVQMYLWEAGEAAELFRQRFQIGVEREVIATEICADLARTAAAFDDQIQPADVDALADAIRELLAEWSQCSADMGPVVELELIRQFVRMVLPRFDFSTRLWSLVVLRLDHALAQRAATALHNPLADATDVLLAACPRFAFLRQALTDAVLYLPPEAEQWADLLALETLLAVVPESRLQRCRLWTLRLHGVVEGFGDRRELLEAAMKQQVQSLRQQWERHELDGFVDAGQRLLRWLDAGATLTTLDLTRPAGAAVWPVMHAILASDEMPVRESVYRMLALQSVGDIDPTLLPAAVTAAAAALLAQPLPEPSVAAIDTGALQDWMQRLVLLHQLLPPALAKAEARVALLRRCMDGGLPERLATPAMAQSWATQTGEVGERWEQLLLQIRTAVRLCEVAETVAAQTAGDVYDCYPEYAQGVGRAACVRDNSFTLQRVAHSLVRDGELAPVTVANWWARTIGAYLRSRTPAVMIFNLGALFDRTGAAIGSEGLALLRDILTPVYRRGFGIELPRELIEADQPAMTPVATAGALWRQVVTSSRPQAPHHGLAMARVPTEGVEELVRSLWAAWQQAFASHGDPELAWRDSAQQLAGALERHPLGELRAAWLRCLATSYAGEIAALAGFRQLLLIRGLPVLTAIALGSQWTARRAELLAEPGLPRALVLSWSAVLDQLEQGLKAGSLALALLNAGRMMLSRVGLAPQQSREAWPRLAARLHARGEGNEAQTLADGFATLAAGVAGLATLCEQLLWASTAQFSEQVEVERAWRELVAGLAVCTLLDAVHPALGRAALSELALGSEGFADPVGDWSVERLTALEEFLQPCFDAALHPSLSRMLGQFREIVEAAGVLMKSSASTGLDAAIALRRHQSAVYSWWHADRLVRVELENLSTPLPGDLTLAAALRSSAPDMVTLRRARSAYRDAVEQAPLSEVDASLLGFHLGLRRAALELAFLREGGDTAPIAAVLVSLAQAEWAEITVSTQREQLDVLLRRLHEEGYEDSSWTVWVVALLRQLKVDDAVAVESR